MRTLALIALRSRSRYAALVGVVASLIYLFQGLSWIDDGESAAQAVSDALPFLLVATLFGVAIDARAFVGRPSEGYPGSPQWSLGRAFLIAAGCALPALIGVVVLQLAALGACTDVKDAWGPVLVLPYLFVMAAATLGLLAQIYVPLLAVAPLAVLSGFMLPIVLSTTPDVAAALFTPIDDGPVGPPFVLRTTTIWFQVGILGTIAVVLLLWSAGVLSARARLPHATAGAACLALVAALCVVTTTINPVRSQVQTASGDDVVCAPANTPSICLLRQHQRLLSRAQEAWRQVSAALPSDWRGRPLGAVEWGVSPRPGYVTFDANSGDPEVTDLELGMAMAVVTTRLYCSSMPQIASAKMELLLFRTHVLSGRTSRELQRILDLPRRAQDRWWLSGGQACPG